MINGFQICFKIGFKFNLRRFCKGLAERYNNRAHEALAHLNRCRKDREWGPDAVYTMVGWCRF